MERPARPVSRSATVSTPEWRVTPERTHQPWSPQWNGVSLPSRREYLVVKVPASRRGKASSQESAEQEVPAADPAAELEAVKPEPEWRSLLEFWRRRD